MTADAHVRYQELAAGYALNALEPHDEQVFLVHLLTCPACAADVAGHQEALAGLAAAWPGTPARGLRDAVLDSIHAEKSPTPAVERKRRRRPTAAWLLAAAASMAAVGLTATTLTMQETVRDTRSELASVRAVIDCIPPGCTASWLASADDTRHGVVLHDGTRARLVVDALPRNDRARSTYVLWLQDGSGRLTAVHGFDVSSSNVVTVQVPEITPPYTGFAISLEAGRTLPGAPSRALLLPTSG